MNLHRVELLNKIWECGESFWRKVPFSSGQSGYLLARKERRIKDFWMHV